jgi:predicted Zn-dependent peptidase
MQHEVSQHELVGGAKLLAINIPNTITFYWASNFRAGYRFVPTELYEMPHLAEHLAFTGTKSFPDSLKFKTQVEQDGTYYNAHTNYDLVWYDFIGSRDELNRIIPLNMSQIYEPLYEAERIAQEKAVITQEMGRRQEDDNWRLGYLLTHSMIPARNPDIEERIKNIQNITRDDILEYHRANYGTANTAFIVAGQYDDKAVARIVGQLNEQLAGRPPGVSQNFAKPEFADYGGKVYAYEPFRESQSVFGLQFTMPGRDDEHIAALRVLSVILTGGMSARLHRKAREAGLTYGISAVSGTSDDDTGFAISSQTGVEKLEALILMSAEELADTGNGGFDEEELERAIGYITGGIRRSYQTPASFANWYAGDFIYGRKLESSEEWIARVQAVDRPAIKCAYDRYMKRSNMTLSMIGKGLPGQIEKYRNLVYHYFT